MGRFPSVLVTGVFPRGSCAERGWRLHVTPIFLRKWTRSLLGSVFATLREALVLAHRVVMLTEPEGPGSHSLVR